MNQRDALRFAAMELCEVATGEAEAYGAGDRATPDEWSARDTERIAAGFAALADRLWFTATGERRTAAPARPVDPDQISLFEESM